MEEKKKKRIRHPKKNKKEEIENIIKEQPTHFVLDVHDSIESNLSKIGR